MSFLSVLFKKQKKTLPKFLRALPGGDLLRLGLFVAATAWFLQGIRYMNWHEAVIKILFDVLITALLFFCGLNMWIAWVIAHSLNFCLNGQLFAMFTHFGANGVSAKYFLNETLRTAEGLKKKTSVAHALAFGSLSRGEYKKTSDIDLRLVPAPGEWNFWKCSFLAFRMRTAGFFRGYPLDLYVFSPKELQRKMRTDEPPVLIAGAVGDLCEIYPSVITLDEFAQLFRNKQLDCQI